MAVRIRLRRHGGKRDAFFRIVVADSRSPRDGRFIEQLGYYAPKDDPGRAKIDADRASYWLDNGAKPSETVRDLFRRAGILESKKEDPEDAAIIVELEKQAEADMPVDEN